MEPLVVRLAREWKAGLLAREQAQMREMAQRWLQVERALEAQIALLAREVAEAREAGRAVTPERLPRMERYQRLLVQVQREAGEYAAWAERLTTSEQRALARLGAEHAAQATAASAEGVIGAYFDRLPVAAVEAMAGLAGDGSPLARLFVEIAPEAAQGLTQALVRGVALGQHPSVVARAMAEGASLGLTRALTIARTEQLRAYRTASLMQYEASGLVRAYKRLAARDGRTCAGCLAADGREYPLSVAFAAHPNCRCALVPVVRGVAEPTWQSASEWLAEQPRPVQEGILGRGRWEAYRDGTPLSRMATTRENATWGAAIVPTPVGEL